MNIQINGHSVNVGEALRHHTHDEVEKTVGKYFETAVSGDVTFSREGSYGFHVDIKVHARRGVVVRGSATGGDAYGALEGALERVAKQLRRYKRRLTDHHRLSPDEGILRAQQYVIRGDDGDAEQPESDAPTIVAEMDSEILTMSVGEAVMRMDLAQGPVVMFRNSVNRRLNVVYRREDGNIGWIDPAEEVREQNGTGNDRGAVRDQAT